MDAWGGSSCKTGEGCCWEGARLEGVGLALCLLGVAGTALLRWWGNSQFLISRVGLAGMHMPRRQPACGGSELSTKRCVV